MPTQYEPDNNQNFMHSEQMSDEAIWDLLSIYADGEATPEEAVCVEALLRRRPSIAGELAFLRRTSDVVRTLAEVEPPSSLRTAIYAATTLRPTLARRIGNAWMRLRPKVAAPMPRFALAGSAFAAAGLAVFLFLPHGQRAGQVRVQPPVHNTVVALETGPKLKAPSTPVRHDGSLRPIAPAGSLTKQPSSHIIVQNALSHPAGHADKMLVTMLRDLERQAVHVALAAKPVHAAIVQKGSSVRHLVTSDLHSKPNAQKPVNVERNLADDRSGQFSPLPKMDLAYQRAILAMSSNKSSDDSLGTNIDGSHDAPTQPAANAAEDADNSPKHAIHVSLSQLPPDSRHYLTTADIKRELDARNLGFSRTTLEGIKRSQATVALIGGKF